jgi:ubiquitin conjugation factor E4 B
MTTNVSRACREAGVRLDEFAVLFTALMASPRHVRSAFLR